MSNQEILASIEEGKKLPDLQAHINEELAKNPKTIVILDDDPTGTQTVNNIPVITQWTEEVISKEIQISSIFFILTNSRSLQADEAKALGKCIGERLKKAAKTYDKELLIISRSDSTLRGHYPIEVNALVSGLGWGKTKHILAPAFFEGGRYTYKNVHYVQDGEQFIPAAETPFAKDSTFGYLASNLKDWVEEKTEGKIKSKEVLSIDMKSLRKKSFENNHSVLEESGPAPIVVNASSYYDLQAFALLCLKHKGKLIFRTAASFINAISGIPVRNCLNKNEIVEHPSDQGYLMIIGSYVPKTTEQLDYLQGHSDATFLELKVHRILDANSWEGFLHDVVHQVNHLIASGKNVVLYTSRDLVQGNTKEKSLEIVNTVSRGILSIIKKLTCRPKFILTKGGITSSDIATKVLQVKRAMVLGQVLKGVPVWRLGKETKFPGLAYIVFPGNVGDTKALYKIVKLLE